MSLTKEEAWKHLDGKDLSNDIAADTHNMHNVLEIDKGGIGEQEIMF